MPTTSSPWTNLFLAYPWLAPATWLVLFPLDFYLTLYGAYLYHAGAKRILAFEGSYELNPLFRSVIDQRRLFPKRFWIVLVVFASALYLFALISSVSEFNRWLFGFVMGSLVLPRVGLVMQHLNNVRLFRRPCRPDTGVTGSIRYDRRTTYLMAANNYLSWMLITGTAAVVSPNEWLYGGVLGCGLMAAKLLILGFRQRRAPVVGTEARDGFPHYETGSKPAI